MYDVILKEVINGIGGYVIINISRVLHEKKREQIRARKTSPDA